MIIVISGDVGSGKSTVCRKLVDTLKSRLTSGGVLTTKSPDKGIVIEDVATGKTGIFASTQNNCSGQRFGKYFFSLSGIQFGMDAINAGAAKDVLLIDEIGPLELKGEGFTNAITLANSGKVKNCIVVIRSGLLDEFRPQFKEKPVVFRVTSKNRDRLPEEIARMLTDALSK